MSNDRTMKKYRLVSLFSGCGGADYGFLGGFEFLGKKYPPLPFNVVWANDIDKHACIVYRENIGDHIHHTDITKINFNEHYPSPEEADMVLGGFPCQEFSFMGLRRGLKSPRGRLYQHMRRAIRHFCPSIFIAENVLGIEHPPNVLTTIIRGLVGKQYPRYNVSCYKINAADYGVPQVRKRIIIVGIRSDLPNTFTPPKTIHSSMKSTSNGKQKWVTAREALEDLWNSSSLNEHSPPDQEKITNATINLQVTNWRDHRLKADYPSNTIRAEHHGHVQIHYNDLSDGSLRRLTVRECARIQGFPDTFVFPVSSCQGYKQIGNAIAPVLAHHWARSVYDWLNSLHKLR